MGKYALIIVAAVMLGSSLMLFSGMRQSIFMSDGQFDTHGERVLAREVAYTGLNHAEQEVFADFAANGSYNGAGTYNGAYQGGTYVVTVTTEVTIEDVDAGCEGDDCAQAYRAVPAWMGGPLWLMAGGGEASFAALTVNPRPVIGAVSALCEALGISFAQCDYAAGGSGPAQGNHVDPSNDKKRIICHFPPGNPENAQTLSVNVNAVGTHFSHHDDYDGPCVCGGQDDGGQDDGGQDDGGQDDGGQDDGGQDDGGQDDGGQDDGGQDDGGQDDGGQDDGGDEIDAIVEQLITTVVTIKAEGTFADERYVVHRVYKYEEQTDSAADDGEEDPEEEEEVEQEGDESDCDYAAGGAGPPNGETVDPGNDKKRIICHFPPGNPENAQTLSVSENAVDTHFDHHDDYDGECVCVSDGGGDDEDDNDDGGEDDDDDSGSTQTIVVTKLKLISSREWAGY